MDKYHCKWRFEPWHDKTNKMACAPSRDSDQPGHPPSLIRVFAVRKKKAWVLSYPFSALRRLIRLGGCPGWSESLLGAHAILLVLSWGNSFYFYLLFLGTALLKIWIYLSCIVRLWIIWALSRKKPVFMVCDQVRHKLACSASKTS